VTDIRYLFKFNRWDWGRAIWVDSDRARTLIGDPDRDAEKLKSVSPVEQAQRLKAPVLLAYGGADQRVPISNGNAMRAALERYGKKYEWVVYPNEGHGFNDDKNRLDFYRRVEAFLRQHLAPIDPAKLQ
jgi:dipeptidyl aminopeptidase/acylaminoacyl peptidase